MAPLIGAISDPFAWRPASLSSTLGAGFDYVIIALAPTVAWLFTPGLEVANRRTAEASPAHYHD